MADVLEMGTKFAPVIISELFSKVKGKSSIAALCGQTPIPFTGITEMTFSMDDEVALVGESEEKPAGETAIEPVTIKPVKVVYGARVSDEFMRASEEKQIQILAAYSDGFAMKVGRGLDIMSMHKMNPRTAQESSLITNSFVDVTNVITYDESAPDDCLQKAIDFIDYDINGIAVSKDFASAMAGMKAQGIRLYPEFAFGASASSFYGTACSVNNTVSFDGATEAIVGDFNAFKWGISEDIPLRVIEFGDPDGQGDLVRHNQVYLLSEVYLGWGILDTNAFCKIAGSASPDSVKTTSAKKAD